MTASGRTQAPGRQTAGFERDLALFGIGVLAILVAIVAGLLAGGAPILAVAGAGAVFIAAAIVLRPDIATLTTIAILYSNAAVVAVRFHSVPVFVVASVPILLAVPLARDLIVRRLPVVAPPIVGWMAILLFIHIVSALFASDTTLAWESFTVFLLEGFVLYLLLINVIRTPKMLRAVTWVLLISGALVSIPSIHQDVTGNYGSVYLGFAQPSDAAFSTGVETLTGAVEQPRLTGPIGEANRFAQIMLMLIPLGIFRFMAERKGSLRLTAAAMTTIITLGVVLTFSRGAAVALGILFLALIALRLVKRRFVLTLGIGLVLLFAAFPQYWTRVSSLAAVSSLAGGSGPGEVDASVLSRATETLAAGLVMIDHPLIGVGPGMFPTYYEAYAQLVGIEVKNDATRESHNLYLGIGAELGIPGLIAFLAIAILTARMLLRARRRSIVRRPDLERLTTPFLLSLLTYHVTGLFLHLSFARFYWMMLAIAAAAAIITLREMDALERDERQGVVGPYSQSV